MAVEAGGGKTPKSRTRWPSGVRRRRGSSFDPRRGEPTGLFPMLGREGGHPLVYSDFGEVPSLLTPATLSRQTLYLVGGAH